MSKRYCRSIIFSKSKFLTNFRFNDFVQMYPCDFKKAPRSNYEHYIPLVIEYWIDEDEKVEVPENLLEIKEFVKDGTVTVNELNRITGLLSSITNHRFIQSIETEIRWGVVIPEEWNDDNKRILSSASSQSILCTYKYPEWGNDLQMSKFSEQRHSDSQFVEHSEYYYQGSTDDKDNIVVFPDTIGKMLHNYLQLDKECQDLVDVIAHLICNGIDIQSKMKSLSFLSFVSAIESLVNFEFRNRKDEIKFECADCQTISESPIKCLKCKRPIWGVKAKFKEFLMTYVSSHSESIKKYNRIYNTRSEIVHNGMLLLGDNRIDWKESKKKDGQTIMHMETLQIARLSLANWLLLGPNKTNETSKGNSRIEAKKN